MQVVHFLTRFVNTYGPHFPNIVNDYAAILWIIHNHNVHSLCEIGTWEGYGSLCFWLNSDLHRQKSIDICQDFVGGGAGYHSNLDRYGKYFVGITPIVLEKADTSEYVPRGNEVYDMVFIDGNHDAENVKIDTKLAVKLGAKIIAYHDYLNSNPGVDVFIDGLSKQMDILHVGGSAVVFFEVTPATVAIINAL
jgi:hypothetical protein